MKRLMWRLLRKNVSVGQMIGFSITNLIGLAIVVIAIQFYCDVKPIFSSEDSFLRKDYMIVTQQVSGVGSLLGSKAEFTEDDIADLEAQPWCTKVGKFTTSDYSIDAVVGLGNGGKELRSHFFFESIPDEYLDVNPSEWKFDPNHPIVPVIVSKDYLSLYNFGFAAAQGMPQISESMMGMIPIMFTFSGNGLTEQIPGKIVGFSSRLNTIVVPESFMKWSNERYSLGEEYPPSRLIIEVNKPGDTAIKEYMDRNEYEIGGDKLESGKANYFLTIIISIVVVVGVIISVLSFFVLMLSIYLLLQKNTRKLQDLLMLGYSPLQVSRPYIRMVMVINITVFLGAALAMWLFRIHYFPLLEAFGVTGSSVAMSLSTGFVIMALITFGNIVAIRRKIGSLWRQCDKK